MRRLLSSEPIWKKCLLILISCIDTCCWSRVVIIEWLLVNDLRVHLLTTNIQLWLRTKNISTSVLEIRSKWLYICIVVVLLLRIVEKTRELITLMVVNRGS